MVRPDISVLAIPYGAYVLGFRDGGAGQRRDRRPADVGGGLDALVVVDTQHVFAAPRSPWGSPMWASVRPHLLERMASYGGRVVATRYVAPARPSGAWVPYLAEWPWALVAADDPLYALVPEVAQVVGDPPRST